MLFESAFWLPLAAALASVALAAWILVRPWAEPFHRWVAVALVLTAVEQGASAALLFSPADALVFRRIGLAAEFLRMATLFLVGAALIGRSSAEGDPRADAPRAPGGGGRGGRGGGDVPLGLRRSRGGGRGPGGGRPHDGRPGPARGLAPGPRARPRAARVGAAGEPRPVPLPHQVRDRGAGGPRGVRALRQLADGDARGVAGPQRRRGRGGDARLGGSRGLRARADAPRAHAGAGGRLAPDGLRLVHAPGGGPLPPRGGARRRGAAPVGPHAQRGRRGAGGVPAHHRARRGAHVAVGARAVPAVRVAPPAALALRLPHEVARGDGLVPLGGVGGRDPRPAARPAGPDLRRRAALDLDALRGGRAVPPRALDEHRAPAASARARAPGGGRSRGVGRAAGALGAALRGGARASRRDVRRAGGPAARLGGARRVPPPQPGARAAATTTWTTSTCCARSPTTRGCSSPRRGWPRTGRPRPSSTPSTASRPSTCTTSRTWPRGCRSWPRTRRSTARTRSSARRR